MKINIGDIYRDQRSKYNFVSKFSSGKILDITFGKYFDFAKSELLLSKGVNEVWSLDVLNNDQYLTVRKLDHEQKICFQKKDIKELEHTKFDSIFSFNIMRVTHNINPLLKIIQNCLSPNGVAVISIYNNDIFLNTDNLNSSKQKLLSTSDFKKTLKLFFSDVSLFSQGDISYMKKFTENVTSKNVTLASTKSLVKHNFKNFFKTNVILQSFYLRYILSLYLYYKKLRRERKLKIDPEKYKIISYNEQKIPISIISICKNMI